jgi:multifunctional methyltransferase subunit TRM112
MAQSAPHHYSFYSISSSARLPSYLSRFFLPVSSFMRLLTHSHLVCVRRGCPKQFPLQLAPTKVEQEETECNEELILHLLPTLDYPVLYSAASVCGLESDLPKPGEEKDSLDINELSKGTQERTEEAIRMIQLLHTILLDTHVMEGNLVCEGCSRKYPIQQGIPNLRLNEDEV